MQQKSTHICFQCGSNLTLISKVTEIIPGSLFPQTISQFRCVNKECQEEKDRQLAKNLKLKEEKDRVIKARLEEKIHQKNLIAESLKGKLKLN